MGSEIMIAQIVPGGQAAAAGLEAGEVILSVDGTELGDGVTMGDALAGRVPGETMSLWVRGRDGERPVDVVLAAHPENEDAAFLGVQSIIAPRMVGLGMSQPQHSIAIRKGEATNRLRADCAGDTLSMYINEELVWETHDSDLSSGDVGLWFRNGPEPGIDIVFDDLAIRAP